MGRKRKGREETKCRCMFCGKIFIRNSHQLRRSGKLKKKIYCNKSCRSKDNCTHLKQYRDQNSILLKSLNKEKRDKYSPFREYLKRSKANKKCRQLDVCDLDLEFLISLWETQKGLCAVTKIKMDIAPCVQRKTRGQEYIKASPYTASLDRIDNSRGYIKGNVRFVVLMFNYARNTFTDEEVLQFCKDAQ